MADTESAGEHGAVLLLVALLAALLCLYAGFAIDGTLLATSKAQQHHSAEYIALGALNAYQQSTKSDVWDRLSDAVQRAREIAGINVIISEPYLKVAEPAKELGTNTSAAYTDNHGRIIPGIWHFNPRAGDCSAQGLPSPCPCNGADFVTPCFQELNFDNAADRAQTPTAFRVELRTSSASPIRTVFARVLGREEVALSSTATAAVIARRGVFLIDLSRSSQIESHIPLEMTTGSFAPRPISTAAEYAFKIKNLSCPADKTNPCLNEDVCEMEGGISDGLYDAVWNRLLKTLSTNSPVRTGPTIPTRHFRSDYECFSVDYSDTLPNGTVANHTGEYLVDTYAGPTSSGGKFEIEPLSTMLTGVAHAAGVFESRRILADRMALIGFDKSARVDKRTFALSETASTTFADIKEISDIINQTDVSLEKRIQNHLFFPMGYGHANIPEALTAAEQLLLTTPGGESAENFVVMMSDGIGNCLLNRNCGDDHTWFSNSLSESLSILQNSYAQNRILFHFIPMGDHAIPHTLLRLSSTSDGNSCMSDTQARLEEPPLNFVDSSSYTAGTAIEAFQKMSRGAGLFPGSNQLYEGVRATGGYWLPIRPCCKSGGVCADVRDDIEDECKNSSLAHGAVINSSSFTDSFGRLLCDPSGRSKREQMTAAIDEILSGDAYVLVGPES